MQEPAYGHWLINHQLIFLSDNALNLAPLDSLLHSTKHDSEIFSLFSSFRRIGNKGYNSDLNNVNNAMLSTFFLKV